MKMKKLMAMLLMGTMILGSLTACSNSKESATDESASDESASDESASEKSEVEEETVTVKMVTNMSAVEGDERVMEEVNRLLKEKINVQLEIECVESGEYDVRTQNIITAGEDYDIMWTRTASNHFASNVTRGSFMALDDLLETEAGQAIVSCFPEWGFGGVSMDGSIYAIPTKNDFVLMFGVYIQADLADEYGLDLDSIETVRDLEPYMDWLVENHPEIIPMKEDEQLQLSQVEPLDTMGLVPNYFISDDGETVYASYEKEEYVENLKMMNEWYHKGYLRSDLLTVTDNTPEVTSNTYAMRINICYPGREVAESVTRGETYYTVNIGRAYATALSGRASALAINASSTKAEAAIKVLSLLYTDAEVYNTLVYGIEGVDYNKIDDNRVEIIEGGYNRSSNAAVLGNSRLQWLKGDEPDGMYEMWDELDEEAQVSSIMGFGFTQSPVESEIAQCTAVWNEYYKALTVTDDFDALYEEVVDALKSAGSETIKAEIERQLAEWKASK